jgi:DNA primase catalytic subunit
MYRWLSYGQVSPVSGGAGAGSAAAAGGPASTTSDYLRRREFSITKVGDIYVRYLCFGSEEEFRTTLDKQRPIKIDIGAVYTKPVRWRGQGRWWRRRLV